MEAEALEAIFMDGFVDESSGDGASYLLKLAPEADEVHVRCALRAVCPPDYPSAARPAVVVEGADGLGAEARRELDAFLEETMRDQEAGCVCLFEVASAVREWLDEHNEAGQADESMYAAMLRRDAAAKKPERKAVVYESSSAPESEEARRLRLGEEEEVRRLERLKYGTAVTAENFSAWWTKFRVDVLGEADEADAVYYDAAGKKKLTGKELFRVGVAAEAPAEPGADLVDGALDEGLFDGGDLGDLDDLDFDSDDDDDDEGA